MADQRRSSAHKPVFKRYGALEVLEEVLNECDSGDEDFGGPHDSASDEGEMDNNQHHHLLSDVVGNMITTRTQNQATVKPKETLSTILMLPKFQMPFPAVVTPPPVARGRVNMLIEIKCLLQ